MIIFLYLVNKSTEVFVNSDIIDIEGFATDMGINEITVKELILSNVLEITPEYKSDLN